VRAPPRRNGNVPKSLRFDVLVARYYPAVYSFASRLTDDPREAIALTRDAFNSTRKQLRSCCDDNVFASILISAVIRAGLTARLNCASCDTRFVQRLYSFLFRSYRKELANITRDDSKFDSPRTSARRWS
jgi:hypothetical protein